MNRKSILISLLVMSVMLGLNAQQIIHDAEYYILKAQHGDKWAQEDDPLNKK